MRQTSGLAVALAIALLAPSFAARAGDGSALGAGSPSAPLRAGVNPAEGSQASPFDLAQGGRGLRPAAAAARREGAIVSVGGRRAVLMWALGLSDPDDLAQYQQAGLNTVYLRISEASSDQLSRVARFASAAEEAGLMVVLSLAPRPLRDASGNELAIDPISDAYAEAVQEFVGAAVEGVGEHPRLIGWAAEVPPADVVNDDDGFVSYLQQWYSSVGALNNSWGTEYEEWDEVTLGAARDVDADSPHGVGRASLDYAYYRQSAYADAVGLWAQAISGADPGRLVLLGNLTDYRSISSAPTTFDGLVLSLYPSTTETDWDSHNVHAVDIARRANQFAAVQTLETSADTSAEALRQWAGLALAHGATGIAFSSWPALREGEELRGAVADIKEMVSQEGYPLAPRAEAAIIYEPFAGGLAGRVGSLYGYLDGFAPGTPTNLFAVARSGSRYGLFDVLDSDSVERQDLSRYGAILAPMAFYLSTDAQVALQNYVLRGGALVVDAGVGMYQAEGVTTSMPAVMREILGMRYEDLTTMQGTEPTLDVGEVYNPAEPTETRPLAPGQQGREVDPALTRFVQQIEDFVTRADVAQYLGDNFVGEAGAGLRVRGLGEGFAVYAPDFLYENWEASDEYFNEFHDRVLSYRSDLQVVEPDSTWPGIAATLYDDRSAGVASPEGTPVSVVLSGAGNQVYLVPAGMERVGNPDEGDRIELLFPGEPLARAIPLPIRLRPTDEEATAVVSVIRYGREGIELLIAGSEAGVGVQDGEVVMGAGTATNLEIEIRSGAYPVSADSIHRVTLQQGRTPQTEELMPDADTGALIINATVSQAAITIETAG